MEKEKLDDDIRANQNSSLLFIKWHSENNVNLFYVNLSDIDDILVKYPKIVIMWGLDFGLENMYSNLVLSWNILIPRIRIIR